MKKLEILLKEKFGLDSFREGQEEIIKHIIEGNDTLVFMPTGGGKSLTYQLSGMYLDGLTIVISPLISLMKDQVDTLNTLGMRAELINSTISYAEQQNIFNELSKISISGTQNPIKFLYIAPERLNSQSFQRVIQGIQIALIAIDEVHCLSQWGHDFRPSYMKIKALIKGLREGRNFPVVGLTATATKKVRQDIVERLGLEVYKEFTKGFDRKNIILIVREMGKKDEKLEKTLEIIKTTPGSGIVYCSSRKVTKEVYDFLVAQGIETGMYTGAMDAFEREQVQNNFMEDKIKVIVATNAFGMGIDKKDIRFVIHYNLPGSIENYYQEVGRAGRDGKKSFGVVIASYGDTKIQEFFIENANPLKEEVLNFYDYLYKDFKLGQGIEESFQKTYYTLAKESGIESDMKVGSIVKILEKYGIISRGFEGEQEEGFRGKGITLIQGKRKHGELFIDWNHQDLLREEAYFKLEQIKKLLFYPSCRKRFILEYFGDDEDLKDLPANCGLCDYCLEKEKFLSGKRENIVNLSIFEIVLDVVKQFDKKYGAKLIVAFLRGSKEKRILDWNLDSKDNYGVLSEYNAELVEGLIESLIKQGYLEKTTGQYPLLGLTKVGIAALRNESILKEDEEELQSYLYMKVKNSAFKKKKSEKKSGELTLKKEKGGTYKETLELFKNGKTLKEIAGERDMTLQTIEGHIVKLYEESELTLTQVLGLVDFHHLKQVKEIFHTQFGGNIATLKPLKDELPDITYFEIKVALAMIEKKDL